MLIYLDKKKTHIQYIFKICETCTTISYIIVYNYLLLHPNQSRLNSIDALCARGETPPCLLLHDRTLQEVNLQFPCPSGCYMLAQAIILREPPPSVVEIESKIEAVIFHGLPGATTVVILLFGMNLTFPGQRSQLETSTTP